MNRITGLKELIIYQNETNNIKVRALYDEEYIIKQDLEYLFVFDKLVEKVESDWE